MDLTLFKKLTLDSIGTLSLQPSSDTILTPENTVATAAGENDGNTVQWGMVAVAVAAPICLVAMGVVAVVLYKRNVATADSA